MTTKKQISIADHFDYKKLIEFTRPSIMMMIFTSIYGMVDGYFVSNYSGAVPFAALNIMWPFLMVISAVGFMFGSGGMALVAMKLGQQKTKQANEIFSLITYVLIITGIIFSILGYIFTPQAAVFLGAADELLPYSIQYARINMVGMTAFMLQHLFQSFLITAERPRMGFWITVAAGITNMILDYYLVAVLKMGLSGAAWATVISQLVGGIIPLIYFMMPNKTVLRLGRTHWNGNAIFRTCINGSSEFLSNAASSIVGMLYNHQLLYFIGTNGVAAYGVIMYVNFIFIGIYFGYAMGISPVIGYHFGANNKEELKNLFNRSMRLLITTGVVLTIIAELTAGILAKVFVGYDTELLELTKRGMMIYDIAFLMMGVNVFGSALFTALNNGKVSALLSVVRSVILEVSMILLLPPIFGGQSLWAIVVLVELGSLLLTVVMIVKYRRFYKYY